MDYFFSKVGRGFRSTVTIVGALACGGVIVMGFMGVQTLAIPICGIIALGPMGMVLVENTKVIRDMEKNVTKFKVENKELKQTNQDLKVTTNNLNQKVDKLDGEIGELDQENEELKTTNNELKTTNNELKTTNNELKETKDKLVLENDRYEGLLDEAETNLDKMTGLANEYQITSQRLGQSLKDAAVNRSELKIQAEELLQIKLDYESENKDLHDNIKLIKEQLVLVTEAKNNYEIQLNHLSENNNELEETTNLLKSELEKAEASYHKSQAALKVLLESTGVLQDLGEHMVKTEEQTSENVSMTQKLLNMMGLSRSEDLFEKLDKDKNQLLSMDEFVKILENANNDDPEDNQSNQDQETN